VSEQQLRLNPIACEAHGLCAELLPERIRLDEWGYPIIDSTPLTPKLRKHARRAVASCPTVALLLQEGAPRSAAGRAPAHRR
jgi:ferredoxin